MAKSVLEMLQILSHIDCRANVVEQPLRTISKIEHRLWENMALPEMVILSFKTCNTGNTYALEISLLF